MRGEIATPVSGWKTGTPWNTHVRTHTHAHTHTVTRAVTKGAASHDKALGRPRELEAVTFL